MKYILKSERSIDSWKYNAKKDILSVYKNLSWPLLNVSDHEDKYRYFIISDNKIVVSSEYGRDGLFDNDPEFFMRCLDARLKFLGFDITYARNKKRTYEIKFKDDADFAFFCLTFSEYITQ
jgi:hypothetical protein